MSDFLKSFVEQYAASVTTAPLDDNGVYPAILVEGPTSADKVKYLHLKAKADGTYSVSFWWSALIAKDGDATNWSKENIVSGQRVWVFLGFIKPPSSDTADMDLMKANFLENKYQFIGTPSANLLRLRTSLFSDEELVAMGPLSYPFDDFLYRAINVKVSVATAASGEPEVRIASNWRYTDMFGAPTLKVSREAVEYKQVAPAAENNLF